MPVYFMAMVVAVDAGNPTEAWETLADPEDPNFGEPVYCSSPFDGEPEMVADPDFDVPAISYGGRPLAPSDES
jgi:hypothetical protein